MCDADIRAQVTPDDDIVSCGERALRSLIPHGQHGRGGWLAHRHQLYRDRSRRRGGCTRSGKPTITASRCFCESPRDIPVGSGRSAACTLESAIPARWAAAPPSGQQWRSQSDWPRCPRSATRWWCWCLAASSSRPSPRSWWCRCCRAGSRGRRWRQPQRSAMQSRCRRRQSWSGSWGRARCARGGYRSGRAGRCGGPRPRRLRCTLVVSTLELPHGDRDGHHQQHRQHRGDDDGGPQQRAFRGRGHGDRLRHPRVVRITRAAQTMAECAREVDTPLVTVLGLLGQRFGEDRVQRCQLGNPIADRRGDALRCWLITTAGLAC